MSAGACIGVRSSRASRFRFVFRLSLPFGRLPRRLFKCKTIFCPAWSTCCSSSAIVVKEIQLTELIQALICWMKYAKLVSLILPRNFVSRLENVVLWRHLIWPLTYFPFSHEIKELWVSTYRFVRWIRLVPREPRYFADRYLSFVCSVTFHWTSAYLQKPQQWPYIYNNQIQIKKLAMGSYYM